MGSGETPGWGSRGQMSEDAGDNVEELVSIPRAMGSLWKALAGASDGMFASAEVRRMG